MTNPNYMLQLQNVTKRFGGITAANNISIQVAEHEIYGVIGPNGAGKTTTFNIITGVYNATEGDVIFDGKRINGLKTHEIATLGIARTFQNIRLFNDLTVYDNLLTSCQKNISYNFFQGIFATKKCRQQEQEMAVVCNKALEDVGLTAQKNMQANNLPYGMQRRLEIARALITNPKLLLLDEPAAGMNEEESAQLSAFIREIRAKNDITIIIIDHHMDVIMSICDRMSVLNFGTLLAEGTPGEIQSNNDVITAYLGVDE
ncbi:ABC transporter ATP-binding protein [Petroclostridium sp. X23]|uniref:ABC transporter ATP-binding protein n=1 Tax=Petroclostridium sp. X23 TaxID=3045146 RepID=UPI0024ACABB5|nr:ABC transporter ATP-binding protein [Petroclostridium sp. X23]WHH61250.1 ABC transporter ATP-binding protein [Petroclostridium sp. X23]